MKHKKSERERKCDELVDKWEQMLHDTFGGEALRADKFITLFIDTWGFLKNEAENGMIPCSDIALTNRMAVFASINDYPPNITPWEFDAYIGFTVSLLEAIYLKSGAEITGGTISVMEYVHCCIDVKFDEAEEAFYKFIKFCYKNGGYYEDDEYYNYYGEGDE